jgi:hypothetical protein
MEARIDKPDCTALAIAPSWAAERQRLLEPGDSVEGRNILVVTKLGLGDSIMFARYLPLLAAPGDRIDVACSPSLRWIFEHVAGVATLLSPPPEQPLGKINLSRAQFDATAEEMPLDEFAAAVAATYLLATVDTMAAHCAGALGHPVWLMLPLYPHSCLGIGRDYTVVPDRTAIAAGRSTRLVVHPGGHHGRASHYQLNIN